MPDFNKLYLKISNKVAYRDLAHRCLATGQGQVYMPHKRSWRLFKVTVMFNRCLDNQSRNASFDLQWLGLGILVTGQTFMACNKWKWKIKDSLMESTWHWLLSPWTPSTIACWQGPQVSSWFRQRLVQEEEHKVGVIQESLMMRLPMHAQMSFVVSKRIFIHPHQGINPDM